MAAKVANRLHVWSVYPTSDEINQLTNEYRTFSRNTISWNEFPPSRLEHVLQRRRLIISIFQTLCSEISNPTLMLICAYDLYSSVCYLVDC